MEGNDPEWTWIMPKRIAAIAALVLLAALAGCASTDATQEPASTAQNAEQAEREPEPTKSPESLSAHAQQVDITAPGEVCDPQNLNDSICAAFYPEQVIANMTSPERAREPLASMALEQKVQLAQQACENMDGGNRPSLVDTILREDDDPTINNDRNNRSIYAAAAMSYCNEHADGKSAQYIAYYQDLGETAAKADFVDKTMPAL